MIGWKSYNKDKQTFCDEIQKKSANSYISHNKDYEILCNTFVKYQFSSEILIRYVIYYKVNKSFGWAKTETYFQNSF